MRALDRTEVSVDHLAQLARRQANHFDRQLQRQRAIALHRKMSRRDLEVNAKHFFQGFRGNLAGLWKRAEPGRQPERALVRAQFSAEAELPAITVQNYLATLRSILEGGDLRVVAEVVQH